MAMAVGVKLDDETRARLKELGCAKRRSTHWMVKEASHETVVAWLDDLAVEADRRTRRARDSSRIGEARR